jgi:hypothetical protein
MEVLDPRASMARKRHDKLVRVSVRNPAPCILHKNQSRGKERSRGKREKLTLCDLRKLILANHMHIHSAPCNYVRLQKEIRTEACLRGGEGGRGRVGGRREATRLGLGLGLGWGRWCRCGYGQGSLLGGGRGCDAATAVWLFGTLCIFKP